MFICLDNTIWQAHKAIQNYFMIEQYQQLMYVSCYFCCMPLKANAYQYRQTMTGLAQGTKPLKMLACISIVPFACQNVDRSTVRLSPKG